jgi:prefoldin subunit 4
MDIIISHLLNISQFLNNPFNTYEIGEIFVLITSEDAQQKLEDYKLEIQQELDDLKLQASEIDILLGKVKSQLYAKFGNNINLEASES